MLQQVASGFGWLRTTDEKTLEPVAPTDKRELLFCLHTFGDDVESKTVAETDDSVGNGAVVLIGGNVVNEAPIDFQAIEWESRQVRER